MPKPAPKGKDLAAFRASHDPSFIVPNAIRKALAELGDSWETETEFMRRAQLNPTKFALFREQFADFYVNVGTDRQPKRLWAGTKGFAEKMRGTLVTG